MRKCLAGAPALLFLCVVGCSDSGPSESDACYDASCEKTPDELGVERSSGGSGTDPEGDGGGGGEEAGDGGSGGGGPDGGTGGEPTLGTDLRPSESGRYFERPDGTPLLWLCDTFYNMWSNSSREDVEWILDRRKKQGYTAIKFYADTRKPNIWGVAPYVDKSDGPFNPAYFEHIDWIVEAARSRGMYVFFVERDNPTWTAKQAEFYGDRYSYQPNIVWASFSTGSRHELLTEALLLGVTGRSLDWLSDDPDVSRAIVGTYFGKTTPEGAGGGIVNIVGGVAGSLEYSEIPYGRVPARPIVLSDGFYTGAATGDLVYRNAMYGAYFQGAFWTAGNSEWYGFAGDWKLHVDDSGPARTALFAHLMKSGNWWDLAPADELLVSGPAGSHVLVSADGDRMFAYAAGAGNITLDLSALSGAAGGTWINPASGEASDAGGSNAEQKAFALPGGWQDGVLVLEIGPQRPLVFLTNPGLADRKTAPATWDLKANATARDGGAIAKVDFFVDGIEVGSDTSAPYEISFKAPAADAYVLSAQAIDSEGRVGTSAVISVVVDPSQDPPVFATPADLPGGKVGEPYLSHYLSFETTSLRAEEFRISSGSLPPGMSLHLGQWGQSAGYAGTPTTAGTYEFEVTADLEDKPSVKRTFTHVISE